MVCPLFPELSLTLSTSSSSWSRPRAGYSCRSRHSHLLRGRAGIAEIIGYGQGHGVSSRRGIGVRQYRSSTGVTVTETPGIRDDGAVIGRSAGKVTGQIRAVDGEACQGRLIRRLRCDYRHGLGNRCRSSAIIGYRQGDGIGSFHSIKVCRCRAGSGVTVTEIPGVAHESAVIG